MRHERAPGAGARVWGALGRACARAGGAMAAGCAGAWGALARPGGAERAAAGRLGRARDGLARLRLAPIGLARVGLALGAAGCLLPLPAAADLAQVPALVPGALAGLFALSLWWPHAGLAALAATVPPAAWVAAAAGAPALRLAEALVLATLAGTLLRLACERRRDTAARAAETGPPAEALQAAGQMEPPAAGRMEQPAAGRRDGPAAEPPRAGNVPPVPPPPAETPAAAPPARTGPPAAALPPGVGPAAAALAAVAAASAAVEAGLLQFGLPWTWAGAADAGRLVAERYLYGTAALVPGLVAAARLVEGAALVVVILVWSARRPALPRQLALATLAGAAAAAAINLGALAAAAAEAEQPGALLLAYLGGRRLSAHVADVNAAGSCFLLAALVGLGLCAGRGGGPAAWALRLATGAAGAAFWLSGSRAALAAALLVGFAAAARRVLARGPGGRRRVALAGLAAALLVTAPLALLAAFPARFGEGGGARGGGDPGGVVPAAWESLAHPLRLRLGWNEASLKMWSTAPLLGVGSGRYYELSGDFMGPALTAHYPRENAHNNFLQIAAELGAAGLAAFLWLLAAAGRRAWQAARAPGPRDPLLAGAGAGVAAYLVTCLAGHPLLVPETAYPFWIVLGLLAARAHGRLQAVARRGSRQAAAPVAAPVPVAVLILILALAATVPLRVAAAARGMTFEGPPSALDVLRSGLFDWETERASGRRFRWTGAHATAFVAGDARAARISFRALHAGPGGPPVRVDVALGGRPVRRIPLRGRQWVDLALPLAPGRAGSLQRIDLRVVPPWPARERRNGDGRTLGVQVRELALIR